MDRSNFYYDQNVTEAELDQAFDDVERMEQELVTDYSLWGVANGLVVQPTSPESLSVEITAGAARNGLGERIEVGSLQTLDLTSYVPGTAGQGVYVDIYVHADRVTSDPRVDGFVNPLDYRSEESFEIVVVSGTPDASPTPPATVANEVKLTRVRLNEGDTEILDNDLDPDPSGIYDPFQFGPENSDTRTPGGPAWKSGQSVQEALNFSNGQFFDLGINLSDRLLNNVGHIVCTDVGSGGQGIDAGSSPLDGVGRVVLVPSTLLGQVGLDLQGRDVENADELKFQATTPKGIVSADTLPVAADLDLTGTLKVVTGEIDLNGNNLTVNGGDIRMGDGSSPFNEGGRIFMERGKIFNCGEIRVDGPPDSGVGYLYIDGSPSDAFGDVLEVSKYCQWDALQMWPMPVSSPAQNPWGGAISDGWYLDAPGPLPVTAYRARWRITLSAQASGFNWHGLCCPLVGLPHKCRLDSFEFGINVSSIVANLEFAVGVYRKVPGTTDLINTGGTLTYGAMPGTGLRWFNLDTINTSKDIMFPNTYSYYAVLFTKASGAFGGGSSGIRVDQARCQYTIREASHVY